MSVIKNKNVIVAVASLITLLVGGGLLYVFFEKTPLLTEAEYPISKVFSYGFTVKNQGDTAVEGVELKVFSPLIQSGTQKLLRLNASHAYSSGSVSVPGQVLTFDFDRLAPFETRIVTLKAEVAFSTQSNALGENNTQAFLRAEKLIEVEDPSIVARANALAKPSDLGTMQSIYDFVKNHINYAGYVEADLGARYALMNKRGDCTEYTSLLVALARANNIPARSVSGFLYASSGVLQPSDYHSWAEVLLEGKWHIVDAQRRNFMKNPDQYLAFRLHSDQNDIPNDHSMRLAYASADVLVSMSKH